MIWRNAFGTDRATGFGSLNALGIVAAIAILTCNATTLAEPGGPPSLAAPNETVEPVEPVNPGSTLGVIGLAFLAVWAIAGLAVILVKRWHRPTPPATSPADTPTAAPRRAPAYASAPELLLAAALVWIGMTIAAVIARSGVVEPPPDPGTSATTLTLLDVGIIQWAGYIGAALAAFAALRLFSPAARRDAIGHNPPARFVHGVLAWLAAMPLLLVLAHLVGFLADAIARLAGEPPPERIVHDTLRDLIAAAPDLGWWLTIAGVTIGAPVIEEVIYRGFLQTGCKRLLTNRAWPAILVTSALFSVAHGGVVDPAALALLFAVGIALGIARERTGSIAAPIAFHALFNAANVAIAMLARPA